jgi:hypothetical protein
MATVEQIALLRRLINQPNDVEPYTDAALNLWIDEAEGDVYAVASQVWREKAAKFAELVDIQEGTSRRSLGDMFEQALEMADGLEPGGGTTMRPGTTRAIERP